MKIAIPVNKDHTLSPIFGRAVSFSIHDLESGTISYLENKDADSAAHGAGIQSAALLSRNQISVVLAAKIGPKACSGLAAAGIQIYKLPADINDAQEALRMFTDRELPVLEC